MTSCSYILSLLVLTFTCSSIANIKTKTHKNMTRNGQKRIDVQVNKWREAQNAINSLIDESIANEVSKAKKEVKALLEKNIVRHLHEAGKQVMEGKIPDEEDEEDQQTQEGKEELQNEKPDGFCQDQFNNCPTLAASGVCETSKEAMKKHCERTCDLCDDEDEELPPATPLSTQGDGTDTWTIIGSDGEKFTAGNIQRGTRKASITTAQVQKLLEYVKQNAPHLTLKKIKPGVLKLVRIKEKKQPHHHHLSLRKHNYQELKKVEQKDEQNDNYWTIKDTNENEEVKMKSKKKTNSGLLHFDLSDILKDNEDFKPSVVSTEVQKKPKSEEYLKHICHPMCKKACISSCAPGCCAGEHRHAFPLYHRKSSHCHPFCKKHCISSCPLTCCAETEKTSKTWRHPHVHHFTPGCHPMCKKDCVPSCPKACCSVEPVKPRSHCHPLCKKSCLSSCPLSCCSHEDRLKEKCHPLCRKTCLPSCPDECCGKHGKEKKLIMKSNPEANGDDEDVTEVKSEHTCPALCPDSCAPACRSGCCNAKEEKKTHYKPVSHVTPSGCTANCVYECLPGCPPACCRSGSSTPKTFNLPSQMSDTQVSPMIFPFSQPIMTPFAAAPPPQPVLPVYQPEMNQAPFSTDRKASSSEVVTQRQSETTNLFAPKHCPSSCLTDCSPECVRSDCCDLD